MARIEAPQRPTWWVRALLFLARKRYHRAFRPLQIAAHVPAFIVPFLMTGRFAHGRGALSADIRTLAMLLVAETNHCAWCIDFGRSLAGRAMAEKTQRVREFETNPAFSDAERAALRYTAEAARTPVEVSDETFAALRSHFTDRQIVELTFAVAVESFFTRINASLDVEAEGFCALAMPGTQRAVA